ncbi:ESX secretion-associated protein EspG [Mycolicibacterium sp.]|uniref:ESX secretion-associated protein EspG n=1 Tax=Mycolicibacterium sp. TaxID=2320850 RepID=UPI003D0F8889
MSTILTGHVGTVELLDLEVISEFYGRDFLPYPFMFTRPGRFATQDEAAAYERTVPDRFKNGDLSVFVECMAAYVDADIRVEAHVQYLPADTPSVRLIAWRTGMFGFFAEQLPDSDAIEIHTVSPYDLGEAVCDHLPLDQAGRHPRIVVPEYAPRAVADFDFDDFGIRDRSGASPDITIDERDVVAYATVQSHWRPTRRWGPDFGKSGAVWLQVEGDGEYLYTPDFSHARPMTRASLRERIDQLIAADVEILQDFLRD